MRATISAEFLSIFSIFFLVILIVNALAFSLIFLVNLNLFRVDFEIASFNFFTAIESVTFYGNKRNFNFSANFNFAQNEIIGNISSNNLYFSSKNFAAYFALFPNVSNSIFNLSQVRLRNVNGVTYVDNN